MAHARSSGGDERIASSEGTECEMVHNTRRITHVEESLCYYWASIESSFVTKHISLWRWLYYTIRTIWRLQRSVPETRPPTLCHHGTDVGSNCYILELKCSATTDAEFAIGVGPGGTERRARSHEWCDAASKCGDSVLHHLDVHSLDSTCTGCTGRGDPR
jgi:hypothetical protein